jgi:hypothetical protein
MKILCVAMMDNGNFMKHAATGLRDYCRVDATAYVQNPPTYVSIPDETVERWNGHPDSIPDADAYLLNDHTYFHHYRFFKDKPRLVKCNGTFARDQGGWFMWDYIKHGTPYLSSPCDYSLASALPFSIQTLPPLIDMRLLPPSNFPEDSIRVGHAPTTDHKGTTLHKHRRNNTIDIDIITGTPWQDAILRKSKCHIFIDQYTVDEPDVAKRARGAFGINAIEALAMGSLVLNNPLHPYVHGHYHAIPLLTFPDDLTLALTADFQQIHNTPQIEPQWAKRHFDLSTQAPKLKELIEWMCA